MIKDLLIDLFFATIIACILFWLFVYFGELYTKKYPNGKFAIWWDKNIVHEVDKNDEKF